MVTLIFRYLFLTRKPCRYRALICNRTLFQTSSNPVSVSIFISIRPFLHHIQKIRAIISHTVSPLTSATAILNLFSPSYTSSSGLRLKAARTYAVLFPFGKNTFPGSARTPFSNAVVRMADSESLVSRLLPVDRSSLNLDELLDHFRKKIGDGEDGIRVETRATESRRRAQIRVITFKESLSKSRCAMKLQIRK